LYGRYRRTWPVKKFWVTRNGVVETHGANCIKRRCPLWVETGR
jgi:hypothetical protein